jgi:hypothetical protein
MEQKRQSQIVTLTFDTNPSGDEKTYVRTFNEFLNIPFNPDGFYVRQIACESNVLPVCVNQTDGTIIDAKEIDEKTVSYALNRTGRVYSIYSDLVNNSIGCVTSGNVTCPNLYFKLSKNVNDSFMFRIDDTKKPSQKSKEIFMLTLEFVKF